MCIIMIQYYLWKLFFVSNHCYYLFYLQNDCNNTLAAVVRVVMRYSGTSWQVAICFSYTELLCGFRILNWWMSLHITQCPHSKWLTRPGVWSKKHGGAV